MDKTMQAGLVISFTVLFTSKPLLITFASHQIIQTFLREIKVITLCTIYPSVDGRFTKCRTLKLETGVY